MRETVNELINDSIDANCTADELKHSVLWIVEDEVVAVKMG